MKLSQRVHIPGGQGVTHCGTVTRMEAARFRVTWDDAERQRGQPRVRYWYLLTEAARFRLGEPGE